MGGTDKMEVFHFRRSTRCSHLIVTECVVIYNMRSDTCFYFVSEQAKRAYKMTVVSMTFGGI